MEEDIDRLIKRELMRKRNKKKEKRIERDIY